MSRFVYFWGPLIDTSKPPWGRSGLLKLSVSQIEGLLALMEQAGKTQESKKPPLPGATPSVTKRFEGVASCSTFQEPVYSLYDKTEQVHSSALDEFHHSLTLAPAMRDGDQPDVELYVCAEDREYTTFAGLEGFPFDGYGPDRADLLVALMRQADSEEDLITLWERLVEADPKAAIDTLEDNLKGDPREDRNGGVCGTWTDAPDLWAVFGPEEVESLTRHDHPDIRREARQTAYEVGVIPSRKPSSERPSLPESGERWPSEVVESGRLYDWLGEDAEFAGQVLERDDLRSLHVDRGFIAGEIAVFYHPELAIRALEDPEIYTARNRHGWSIAHQAVAHEEAALQALQDPDIWKITAPDGIAVVHVAADRSVAAVRTILENPDILEFGRAGYTVGKYLMSRHQEAVIRCISKYPELRSRVPGTFEDSTDPNEAVVQHYELFEDVLGNPATFHEAFRELLHCIPGRTLVELDARPDRFPNVELLDKEDLRPALGAEDQQVRQLAGRLIGRLPLGEASNAIGE